MKIKNTTQLKELPPLTNFESDAEFEIYNDAAGKLAMVKRILTRRMLPILLLFLALLPVFLQSVSGGSSFSWEKFFNCHNT